jgi:hypothetical protein
MLRPNSPTYSKSPMSSCMCVGIPEMMEYVLDLRGVIDGRLCFRANNKPTANIALDLPCCSAILKRPSDAWRCQSEMMRQLTPTLPAAGRGRVVTATMTHARVKSIHDLTRVLKLHVAFVISHNSHLRSPYPIPIP